MAVCEDDVGLTTNRQNSSQYDENQEERRGVEKTTADKSKEEWRREKAKKTESSNIPDGSDQQ